ncbi:MAG: RNA polymerase sigma factor [Tepidisphaeraceae bacterium]
MPLDPHFNDVRLLNAWRSRGDRDAMDALIRRHIHFVYGAARRQLRGDVAWAEDVTQAVFMLLIQKSPRLASDAALAVWLHRATRNACANARRMQARHVFRERAVARQEIELNPNTNELDELDEQRHLLGFLDEGIAQLGRRDRDGIVLCYFQRQSYRQIGASLGVSEEAARKRVTRAIEKLRDFFHLRGAIPATTTCAAVAACLSQQSVVAAPASLVASTANIAGISQIAGTAGTALLGGSLAHTGSGTSATQIMKGVLHTMFISKPKLAAAACVSILVVGAATTTVLQQALARSSSVVASDADDTAESFIATLPNGLSIQFLGVNDIPAAKDGWRAIDGAKIAPPTSPFDREPRWITEATRQVLVRKTGPETSYRAQVRGGELHAEHDLNGTQPGESYWRYSVTPQAGRDAIDLVIEVADGEWQALCEGENRPGQGLGMHKTPHGGVAMTHLMDHPNGGTMLYVAHEPSELAWRYCATDQDGKLHPCVDIETNQAGKIVTAVVQFDLAVDQIASVAAQTRAFNRKLNAKNISVNPEKPTKPEISLTGEN